MLLFVQEFSTCTYLKSVVQFACTMYRANILRTKCCIILYLKGKLLTLSNSYLVNKTAVRSPSLTLKKEDRVEEDDTRALLYAKRNIIDRLSMICCTFIVVDLTVHFQYDTYG